MSYGIFILALSVIVLILICVCIYLYIKIVSLDNITSDLFSYIYLLDNRLDKHIDESKDKVKLFENN